MGKDVSAHNFEEEGDPNGDVAQSARSIDRLVETLRERGPITLCREVDMGPKVAEIRLERIDSSISSGVERTSLSA